MQEPMIIFTIAAAGLLGIAIISATIIRLWRDWISYKQNELSYAQSGGSSSDHAVSHNANTRIELADLRERLRKLEAIAAGVDL